MAIKNEQVIELTILGFGESSSSGDKATSGEKLGDEAIESLSRPGVSHHSGRD